MSSKLSHLSSEGTANMVDVSAKESTIRSATAMAIVDLGEEIMEELVQNDLQSKKGAVFEVARIAGIMAVKKTSDLIPLCHPLPLPKIGVDIRCLDSESVIIECTAKTEGKTGVEMEALTGASVAALTIYDMCKAMSHDIIIREVKLLEKYGGKRDFKRNET